MGEVGFQEPVLVNGIMSDPDQDTQVEHVRAVHWTVLQIETAEFVGDVVKYD